LVVGVDKINYDKASLIYLVQMCDDVPRSWWHMLVVGCDLNKGVTKKG